MNLSGEELPRLQTCDVFIDGHDDDMSGRVDEEGALRLPSCHKMSSLAGAECIYNSCGGPYLV